MPAVTVRPRSWGRSAVGGRRSAVAQMVLELLAEVVGAFVAVHTTGERTIGMNEGRKKTLEFVPLLEFLSATRIVRRNLRSVLTAINPDRRFFDGP